MSRFLKSQRHLVKCLGLVLLFGLPSLGLIGGCSDGGGGNDSQALTENDFAEDSGLTADLEEGVVVTFLEAPNSEPPENDTGQVGVDLIPITFRQLVDQTFCWEDDDVDAMNYMVLLDSQGKEVLRVDTNGDCVTARIETGYHVMELHHDESRDTLPIFIIPNPEELEQARRTEGLIDRVNVAAANILKAIQKTVTKDAKAQTVMENRSTLLRTRSCVGCNLEGARLNNADLSGANLSRAILRDANLFLAKLFGADLTGADLSGATWCDGCVCARGSIGLCIRCRSVDFCNGL